MTSILAIFGAAALAAGGDAFPAIPYQQFTLPNGLHVILSEDHTAPVVGIDVLYDVGSKDEKPGRTGFAHLFEHLMFQGTEHLPKGEADRLIEAAGGTSNGATSTDRTEYWEQVPSNALEQMLFIESDRMGYLLPTLDQAKLDNQREVVRNERRQNYEMQPYGSAWKVLGENLWDPSFPYHWEPIGSHEDLQAATLEDVREFFRRWYGPGNASLAIVGDIDPARTRAAVEKWFGGIPASAAPVHAAPVPKALEGEKRVTIEDEVQLPRLYVGWQSPKNYAPDDAALDILGDILSSGKSSRLVKRLVMEDRSAQSVMAGQQGEALAGTFLVVATPKPGVKLETLLKSIDEELARIAREAPSAEELQRAKNQVESQMIFGLEPVGGFGGRAAHLNAYYWETGDPGYLAKDLERYRAVTAEDVRAVAARWLRPDRRVVLSVVPRAGGLAAPSPRAAPPAPGRQQTEVK
ncbi:MAG TPA: pitrilysin family protein [Anaeromyxobacteraceae bacterium]|nr:pitrilysin family protein [Anaeromyxobacteraceae bacterium]